MSLGIVHLCLYIMIHLHGETFSYTFETSEVHIYESMVKIKILENLEEKTPLGMTSGNKYLKSVIECVPD